MISPRGSQLFLITPFTLQLTDAKSFQSNCTLPATNVNIMYGGNVRGTFDILWSCIFTLLICTWTVQHLNIPEQDSSTTRRKGVLANVKSNWIPIKWMLSTLVMPELIAAKAFQDWHMSRKSYREMQLFAAQDKVEWTLIHSYYANIGGFVLKLPPKSNTASNSKSDNGSSGPDHPSVPPIENSLRVATDSSIFNTYDSGGKIAFYALKRYFCAFKEKPDIEGERCEEPTLSPLDSDPELELKLHINADQLRALRSIQFIPNIPAISSKEIGDKNKSDVFLKGTALIQLIWLLTQVIIRSIKGLPISHLEVAVLAFAGSTIFTYAFSWSKPQGVNNPTYVKPPAKTVIDNVVLATLHTQLVPLSGYTGTRVSSVFLDGPPNINLLHPIPNDAEYDIRPRFFNWTSRFTYYFMGLTISAVLFGIIHCLAWNFHYPSLLEKILWRICSVWITLWTPIYMLNFVAYGRLKRLPGALKVAQMVEILLFLGYVCARFCLFVLVFRGLFYLETATFKSTLDGIIPHIQ
ncbi:hypothetical protein B0O99DRAFT_690409 [Bisporella sp. PMI_857]|nr:hypothetical protein B0O99DRAFT_690409 [Bisporella sp. PMI_857]